MGSERRNDKVGGPRLRGRPKYARNAAPASRAGARMGVVLAMDICDSGSCMREASCYCEKCGAKLCMKCAEECRFDCPACGTMGSMRETV